MVKIIVALALALGVVSAVPVVGAVRLEHDVQKQSNYCITVEDPQTPQFCDPAAGAPQRRDTPGHLVTS